MNGKHIFCTYFLVIHLNENEFDFCNSFRRSIHKKKKDWHRNEHGKWWYNASLNGMRPCSVDEWRIFRSMSYFFSLHWIVPAWLEKIYETVLLNWIKKEQRKWKFRFRMNLNLITPTMKLCSYIVHNDTSYLKLINDMDDFCQIIEFKDWYSSKKHGRYAKEEMKYPLNICTQQEFSTIPNTNTRMLCNCNEFRWTNNNINNNNNRESSILYLYKYLCTYE